MAETKNTLPLTYGQFELRGLVGGVVASNFYQELTTKTKKQMKKLRFFVQTSEHNRVYVDLIGLEQSTVRFQKYNTDLKKYETKEVPWALRKTFNENGFKLKGICTGLEKKTDTKGNVVNDVRYHTSYDAIDYIRQHLKDGMTVYCRGDLSYSYSNDKTYTSLNLSQISLVKPQDELDSESIKLIGTSDNNKEVNNFNQTIILQEVVKDEDKPNAMRINGLALNSSGAVNISYLTNDAKLGTTLSRLPQYTSVLVAGHITQEVIMEVEEDDGWGEGNVLDRKQSFTSTYLVTGADRNSVNKETYNEENIAAFVATKREYGKTSTETVTNLTSSLDTDTLPSFDEDDDW